MNAEKGKHNKQVYGKKFIVKACFVIEKNRIFFTHTNEYLEQKSPNVDRC